MVAHWGHSCFSLIEIFPVQISHFSFLQCEVLPYRARWSNAHAHFIQPVLKHLFNNYPYGSTPIQFSMSK